MSVRNVIFASVVLNITFLIVNSKQCGVPLIAMQVILTYSS